VAVGGGVQGATPASGAGRKGGVWRCGIYGGSGGTAEGAGAGRAAAAGLGVRRRLGWACSGGRGLVASGRAGGGGGSFVLRFSFFQPTVQVNNWPNGPFILVGILEVV
jgi:hypothetical protein